MADTFLVPLPGIGTLALTRPQFEAALNAGRDVGTPAPGHSLSASDGETRLLDAHQLEEITQVPASWWMAQARAHRIPFRKVGRRVRFVLDEVLSSEEIKRRDGPAANAAHRPISYGGALAR
jgi:hypothetical protein